MAAQDRNSEADALAVTPVLVEDPAHFRAMALCSLALAAGRLKDATKEAYRDSWRRPNGNVRVGQEKCVKQELEDVRLAFELVEQVGWRKPRTG